MSIENLQLDTRQLLEVISSETTCLLLFITLALFQFILLRRHFQINKQCLELKSTIYAVISSMQKRRFKRKQARHKKDILEKSVSSGTTAVEVIHQTLSGATFDAIETFAEKPDTKANTKVVRHFYDQSAKGIFHSLRVANKQLGGLADDLINSKQKHRKDKPKD